MTPTTPNESSAAPPPHRRAWQLFYGPGLLAAALILIPCALFSVLVRLAAASVDLHRDRVTDWISAQLGQEVQLGTLHAEIRGAWQPVLVLERLRTLDAGNGFALEVQRAELVADPLASLLLREPRIDTLYLRGVRLQAAVPPLRLPPPGPTTQQGAAPMTRYWPRAAILDDLELRRHTPGDSGATRTWRAQRIAFRRHGSELRGWGSLKVAGNPEEILDFTATARWAGRARPEEVTARLSLQGADADAWLQLLRRLPQGEEGAEALPEAAAGRLYGRLEGRWQARKGWSAKAELRGDLELEQDGTRVPLQDLQAYLAARSTSRGSAQYAAALRSLHTDSGRWPETLLRLARDPHGTTLEWHCEQLELAAAADLLPLLPLAPELRQKLHELRHRRAAGKLRDLRWRRRGTTTGQFSWSTLLEELRWEGDADLPGAQALRGVLRGTESSSELVFQARRIDLRLPDLYPDEKLLLAEAQGTLRAQGMGQGDTWQLQLPQLTARWGVVPLRLHGSMTLRDTDVQNLGVTLELEDIAVEEFMRRLPTAPDLIPADLHRRLGAALPHGRIVHSRIILRGDPGRWPLPDEHGYFEAHIKATGTEFRYHPDWPPLTGAALELDIDPQALRARIKEADIHPGLKLQGDLEVPFNADQGIRVQTVLRGTLEQLRLALPATPLLDAAQTARLQDIAVAGGMRLELDLTLRPSIQGRPDGSPLPETAAAQRAGAEQLSLERLDGSLHLEAAELRQTGGEQFFLDQLDGSLELTRDGLHARALRGRWHGLPLLLDLDYQAAASEPLHLRARGQVDAQLLRSLAESAHPILARILDGTRLHGETSWEAALEPGGTTAGAQHPARLQLRSSMQGLAGKLPVPLDKEAAATLPLQLSYELASGNWELKSGEDSLRRSSLPQHRGVAWELHMETLPAARWLALLGTPARPSAPRAGPGSYATPISSPPPPGTPWRFTLKTANLEFGSLQPGPAFMQIERDAHGNLRGSLEGAMQGRWELPNVPGAALQIDLEQLRLTAPPTKATADQAATATADQATATTAVPAESPAPAPEARWKPPRDWPPVQLRIKQLSRGGIDDGSLEAHLRSRPDGAVLDYLLLEKEGLRVVGGEASWDGAGSADEHTRLELQLQAPRLTDVLNLLIASPGSIEDGPSKLRLRVRWQGAPQDFSLEKLGGQLYFEVGAGRITDVNPLLLRLLGLLQFKRLFALLRLRLDKVFGGTGTAFREIQGSMEIEAGVGESELLVEGDTFHLVVSGRTGLATRDYDQVAVLFPRPVSGTLEGITSPLGSAGQLLNALVQKILLGLPENIDKAFRVEYRITGNWEDPIVEALNSKPAAERSPLDPRP